MELFLAKHLRSKGYGVYVDEDKEEEGSEAGTQKDQGVPKSFLDAILDATS
jgi:hypothetical protein